jgi:hypothetical protein
VQALYRAGADVVLPSRVPRSAAAQPRTGSLAPRKPVPAQASPTARLAAPPLTTVRFDLRQAGRGRAELIMASLAGRESNLATVHEEWKVIKRSSA